MPQAEVRQAIGFPVRSADSFIRLFELWHHTVLRLLRLVPFGQRFETFKFQSESGVNVHDLGSDRGVSFRQRCVNAHSRALEPGETGNHNLAVQFGGA